VWRLLTYITAIDGWGVFVTPLWQGLITFARVVVLAVVSTVVWVPIGVKIGSSPRASDQVRHGDSGRADRLVLATARGRVDLLACYALSPYTPGGSFREDHDTGSA
jgi:hypothetical protein